MKRCKIYFTGMSGEVYTDTIDGDHIAAERYVRDNFLHGMFHGTKPSEFDGARIWEITPGAVESVCIEEFEEEES
jgi:hypothetical protein